MLMLALMEVGGVRVGAMELGGVVVDGGGLELFWHWCLCWRDVVMEYLVPVKLLRV